MHQHQHLVQFAIELSDVLRLAVIHELFAVIGEHNEERIRVEPQFLINLSDIRVDVSDLTEVASPISRSVRFKAPIIRLSLQVRHMNIIEMDIEKVRARRPQVLLPFLKFINDVLGRQVVRFKKTIEAARKTLLIPDIPVRRNSESSVAWSLKNSGRVVRVSAILFTSTVAFPSASKARIWSSCA